jgi:predicted phosphodiesterase
VSGWAALLLGCGAPDFPPPAVAPWVVAEADRVRFVAVGDVGKGNASQRHVARAIAETCTVRGCDFVVLLGDNLYPRGMEGPEDPQAALVLTDVYAPLGLPVYAVLGNHDYAHGRDDARAEWQIAFADREPWLHMPARAYSFRAGPADVFAIDTTWAFWRGSEPQQSWLTAALDASAAPWRVVVGHHPMRSNGPHGDVGAYEGLSGVPIASGTRVQGLLDVTCGRADLYLSGHDHSLQWQSACGVELIVSGAGASTTPIEGDAPSRFERAAEGFAWIELGSEGMTAAFVDQHGAVLHEDRVRRAR